MFLEPFVCAMWNMNIQTYCLMYTCCWFSQILCCHVLIIYEYHTHCFTGCATQENTRYTYIDPQACKRVCTRMHIDGLTQQRHHSNALAQETRPPALSHRSTQIRIYVLAYRWAGARPCDFWCVSSGDSTVPHQTIGMIMEIYASAWVLNIAVQ